MSIQIYILSKLNEGNNYPYNLKKELSSPIPFDQMANLTESKLYYHFDSLTKQGLIEPVEIIKEEHRPDKQVFAITEKGKKQLPKKIYSALEKAKTIAEMIVALMFLKHVEGDQVISILEKNLLDLKRKKDKLEVLIDQIEGQNKNVELLEFSESYFTTKIADEIDWNKRLIEQLKNKVEKES